MKSSSAADQVDGRVMSSICIGAPGIITASGVGNGMGA
jgi:hypothetical protein